MIRDEVKLTESRGGGSSFMGWLWAGKPPVERWQFKKERRIELEECWESEGTVIVD